MDLCFYGALAPIKFPPLRQLDSKKSQDKVATLGESSEIIPNKSLFSPPSRQERQGFRPKN
jgi:hypothetical protein